MYNKELDASFRGYCDAKGIDLVAYNRELDSSNGWGLSWMKRMYLLIFCLLLLGCSEQTIKVASDVHEMNRHVIHKEVPQHEVDSEAFFVDLTSFERREPMEWGENVTAVKNQFQTEEKEIALTFDACGGEYGNGYDEELIHFLRTEKIPATLFVNERWILENESIFIDLATEPLFQIENHGTNHSPLSVDGGEAWGIAATESAEEVYAEIMDNHKTVQELTGKEMSLFRSGTAYYDEVAVELANALGYEVVNYDILGDAGATYSSNQVRDALLNAEPGSIALLHMNQPASGTAQGVIEAVPSLKERGFEFVLLEGKKLE
ncbi:peptidoglycan/xylan/chitin deacetylase (PgdA/CDA1 family) [Pseudogracilibacillus auburnensis]|uniref:Peptidoglycan/xylan/chitin deacetylase (PgdA/CDA1 family) n=2 Tax=Pseudogracilibacillus auburnensis TaxID=1494959 RepID=A0A2V3VYF9_9BACI|nr:peptidoglycan/xylan/chitin deacetylase (PgdA/CDA1 family) [Pseudogracilibacillus auburnensis]